MHKSEEKKRLDLHNFLPPRHKKTARQENHDTLQSKKVDIDGDGGFARLTVSNCLAGAWGDVGKGADESHGSGDLEEPQINPAAEIRRGDGAFR